MSAPLKVLWHWFAMGPYHFARMSAIAAQPGIDLTVVETTSNDDHGWGRAAEQLPFRLITLSAEMLSASTHGKTANDFARVLREIQPDVLVASGYAEPHSRHAVLEYSREFPRTSVLLWSETTSFDNRRSFFAEKIKGSIVQAFDGAIVAGTPHIRYLHNLGMSQDVIERVGGCVDNGYFSRSSDAARAQSATRPIGSSYFLYVGRFIPVKNLYTLIRGYHLYRVMTSGTAHHLVLVGSGPEEGALRQLADELHVDGVHFEGVRQIDELPSYYAHASAFVLPSWSEPWGLVVNEAMASGLPVIASTAVGSAEDLILPGETGLLFDPKKPAELASCFEQIAKQPALASRMGSAAQTQVDFVSLDKYAMKAVNHMRALHERCRQRQTHSIALLPRAFSAVERWVH